VLLISITLKIKINKNTQMKTSIEKIKNLNHNLLMTNKKLSSNKENLKNLCLHHSKIIKNQTKKKENKEFLSLHHLTKDLLLIFKEKLLSICKILKSSKLILKWKKLLRKIYHYFKNSFSKINKLKISLTRFLEKINKRKI
jgi:hypothetical protein